LTYGKHKKTKTVVEAIGNVSFSSLALGTDSVALKLNGADLGGRTVVSHEVYRTRYAHASCQPGLRSAENRRARDRHPV
jgi:hypothetical protein